ncbi:MAG: metalloregulator ArsR/SmtB family transcription factor [Candidatus Sericytochromatia bacterium]|nr:metalloregulator ArsR/SmtB family transcription factor [Candidatus Sericytochromatia bacterium]
MPHRKIAARELAELFGVLSHPERLQIVEELRQGELDVASLQTILGVSHAKTSRQLAILRAQRLVAERQEGRHVFYRLTDRGLAIWIAQGLDFIQTSRFTPEDVREAARRSQADWLGPAPNQ